MKIHETTSSKPLRQSASGGRPINADWHQHHRMPRNPTVDQRLAWHLEHQKHCTCRSLSAKMLKQLQEKAKIARRRRSTPADAT